MLLQDGSYSTLDMFIVGFVFGAPRFPCGLVGFENGRLTPEVLPFHGAWFLCFSILAHVALNKTP